MSQKLGILPAKTTLGERDALHVQYIIAITGEDLSPGQKIKFSNSYKVVTEANFNDFDGIVDPFYEGTIKKGWAIIILIKPDLVSNFKHSFSFKNESSWDDDDTYCPGCF